MPEGSDQEKTEAATPRRLEKAREQGQSAQTRELPSALVLGASLLVFTFMASWLWDHLLDLVRTPLAEIGQVDLTIDTLWLISAQLTIKMAILLAPFLTAVVVAGVLGSVGQIGLLFSAEPLALKFERLDPIQGTRNLISVRSLVELGKNIIKIVVIGWLVYVGIKAVSREILDLEKLEPVAILAFLMRVWFGLFLRVTIALFVLGLLDYAFQQYEFKRQMKMTRQEVLDEYKEIEGDPRVRARIRSIQREVAMRRMMKEVPKADVVITNPTHVAVALRYRERVDRAPRVVAKGQGFVALRIKELAQQHGVPILERPDLARAIYRLVKMDQCVPETLYQAVAEILAYVYRLNERRSA